MVDYLKTIEIVDSSKVIEIIEIEPCGILEKFSYLIKRLVSDDNGRFVSSGNRVRKSFGYSLRYFLTVQSYGHCC